MFIFPKADLTAKTRQNYEINQKKSNMNINFMQKAHQYILTSNLIY